MFKLFGFLLLLAAFPILFLNEGRAVRTARSLEEGAAVVVHVEAAPVQPANEGKLVHFTGPAVTTAMVRDPVFGVEARALQLSRKVEMYQWRRISRGRESSSRPETPEDYERVWSDQWVSTAGSRTPVGRENPSALPYQSITVSARDVVVGDFQVPQRAIAGLDGNFAPLTLDAPAIAALPAVPGIPSTGRPKLDTGAGTAGGLFIGENPAEPKVGDVRVRFALKGLSEISVVGRQHGTTIEPFPTKAGRPVEMALVGAIDARDMFDGALTANTILTWGLRIAGGLLMSIGSFMIAKVRGLLSFVPVLGSALNAGAELVAFGFASVASLATIAFAWIAYRPAFGLTLLILSGALGAVIVRRARRKQRSPAS